MSSTKKTGGIDSEVGSMGDFATEFVGSIAEPPGGWDAHDARVRASVAERDAEQQKLASRRDDVLELKRQQRLVEMGMPAKEVRRLVTGEDAVVETKAMRRVRAFDASDEEILVIAGNPGSGKTTAAVWWFLQDGPTSQLLKLRDPFFVPSFRLERVSRYSDDDMSKIELARRLVIDDIGVEYLDTKGAFSSLFDGLFNARYANMLKTIITTNLQRDAFKERVGDRVADRIREVGAFFWTDDTSMRKKGVR